MLRTQLAAIAWKSNWLPTFACLLHSDLAGGEGLGSSGHSQVLLKRNAQLQCNANNKKALGQQVI